MRGILQLNCSKATLIHREFFQIILEQKKKCVRSCRFAKGAFLQLKHLPTPPSPVAVTTAQKKYTGGSPPRRERELAGYVKVKGGTARKFLALRRQKKTCKTGVECVIKRNCSCFKLLSTLFNLVTSPILSPPR